MTEKLAYTIEEAAELIGSTDSFLRDAVTARKIRHTRLGGKAGRGVRFTRQQLMDFLENNVVEAQQ